MVFEIRAFDFEGTFVVEDRALATRPFVATVKKTVTASSAALSSVVAFAVAGSVAIVLVANSFVVKDHTRYTVIESQAVHIGYWDLHHHFCFTFYF